MKTAADIAKALLGGIIATAGFFLWIYGVGITVGVEQEVAKQVLSTLTDMKADVRALNAEIQQVRLGVAMTTRSLEEHQRRLDLLERHTWGPRSNALTPPRPPRQ
jgi:hypothetical protein